MKLEDLLTESFKRMRLKYSGTRPEYQVKDPNPYVLVIDDDYNVDGNGKSILGINLNYIKADKKKLIDDVNKHDNAKGFRGFEWTSKVRFHMSRDKEGASRWIGEQRKRRYKELVEAFPHLAKFIRRYKIQGVKDSERVFLK
jgi:hypothetical protein